MHASFHHLGASVFDFLFPRRCAACGGVGSDFCDACYRGIAAAGPVHRSPFNAGPPITALGAYDGALRAAVLALKFRGARCVGVRLGRLLAQKIARPFDVVIPVPLHVDRHRERGYNQAAEIGRGVAAESGRRMLQNALTRVRATRPQSALDLVERFANVDRAFVAGQEAKSAEGRRVLLVDDVVTTGATGRACAAALAAANVGDVYLASVSLRL